MRRAKFLLLSLGLSVSLMVATPLLAQPIQTTTMQSQFKAIEDLLDAGQFAQAEPLALSALAQARRRVRSEPLALTEALRLVGHALSEQGKDAQAVPYRREAVARWRAAGPSQAANLAKSISNLATDLDDARQNQSEAKSLFLESIALLTQAEPVRTTTRASVMLNFAAHLAQYDATSEAEAMLKSAIALVDQDPQPSLGLKIGLLNNLSTLQDVPGQLQPMLQTREAIVDVYGQMGPSGLVRRGDARIQVSVALLRLGRDAQSEAQIRLAIADYRAANPAVPAQLSMALQLLAATATSQGRTKEAQFIMVEALDLLRSTASPQTPFAALSDDAKEMRLRLVSGLGMQGTGLMLSREGDFGEAMFLEAINLGRDLPDSGKPVLAIAQFGLSSLRLRQRRYPEGIALLEKVVQAFTEAFGAEDPFALYVAQRLAIAHMANDQIDAGLAEIARIRNVLLSQPAGWNPRRSEIRQTYADFLMSAENPTEAYAEFRDVGFELMTGPGRSSAIDPAERQAFLEGREVFIKQIQAGWNVAYDLKRQSAH